MITYRVPNVLPNASDVHFGHFGTCSISAQSNFAVGAVVNATFGSITELTFYITALLRGHQAANPCLQEVVKAALTGTLLGCILFIPVSHLHHILHGWEWVGKNKHSQKYVSNFKLINHNSASPTEEIIWFIF